MAKTIGLDEIGDAIRQELTIYHQDVIEKQDQASKEALAKLVKLTKARAPVGARGDFKRSIAGKLLERTARGSTYVWYVKPPNHRLAHLLAHGHATKNGGRTKADPFLSSSLDEVLPEYERNMEEAVKG